MKTISLIPGTTSVSLADVDGPKINAPDEVKIKMWHVGICWNFLYQFQGGLTSSFCRRN